MSTFVESGSTYTNCNALSGAAIYLQGANTITISGANFTSNTASLGGAIYIYYPSTFTGTMSANIGITSCTFTSNYATQSGGALYII